VNAPPGNENATTKQRCPACAEIGKDTAGDNLTVFPSGKFHCIAAGKDKAHNRRIIELMPELGSKDTLPSSGPCLARPIPKPKRLDLLSRIKEDFFATVADLWESSPVRCDEDLNEAQAFLRLFPSDALLWLAPDIYQTGEPKHAKFFRTRTEWQRETFTAPGMRIAPSWFKPGSYSRGADSVAEHLFTVIESDEIGEGKLYADKDQFCSLTRWLREACGWHLAAVVDSGRRSLHAWFKHPGFADMTQLAEHAAVLGLDVKFSEPSQPWRLPGMKREKSDTRQQLLYLETEGSI
jgi:hypothetical protein